MELADVELRTQLSLGLRAQLADLELPDLVGKRLSRDRDEALRLGSGIAAPARAVVEDVLDRLVARPTLRMYAGIDDQADCTEQLRIQVAEILVRVGVDPQFAPKRFRIEPPAFDVGGVAAEAHEIGQALILLRQADLEVMPWRAFVQIK